MNRRRGPCFTMALAMIALLISVGSVGTTATRGSDDWTPPNDAAQRSNPLHGRSDLSAGGRKLYHQRCAQCHAEDGTGSARAPDLTRRAVQAQRDGALFWRISGGNAYTGMPSFSYLPELQRWQLVLHLRTLKPVE